MRTQHITLLDGYLKSFLQSDVLRKYGYCFKLYCHKSLYDNLSKEVKEKADYKSIFVNDPEKRRFLLSSFIEFFTIFRIILKMNKEDKLLITCLFSNSLFLLEIMTRFLSRENIYIILHAELEAIKDESIRLSKARYGYWFWLWWRKRALSNSFKLVVIDDFIKTAILKAEIKPAAPHDVIVLHHPVEPLEPLPKNDADAPLKICFIGQKMRYKGFDIFAEVAQKYQAHRFFVIGNGQSVDFHTNEIVEFSSASDFNKAVHGCDVALLPYSSAYDVSLSAAFLDAVSSGLMIIASNRDSFKALQGEFGEDFVKCYSSKEELFDIMADLKTDIRQLRGERLERAKMSKFSRQNIIKDIESFFLPQKERSSS